MALTRAAVVCGLPSMGRIHRCRNREPAPAGVADNKPSPRQSSPGVHYRAPRLRPGRRNRSAWNCCACTVPPWPPWPQLRGPACSWNCPFAVVRPEVPRRSPPYGAAVPPLPPACHRSVCALATLLIKTVAYLLDHRRGTADVWCEVVLVRPPILFLFR